MFKNYFIYNKGKKAVRVFLMLNVGYKILAGHVFFWTKIGQQSSPKIKQVKSLEFGGLNDDWWATKLAKSDTVGAWRVRRLKQSAP